MVWVEEGAVAEAPWAFGDVDVSGMVCDGVVAGALLGAGDVVGAVAAALVRSQRGSWVAAPTITAMARIAPMAMYKARWLPAVGGGGARPVLTGGAGVAVKGGGVGPEFRGAGAGGACVGRVNDVG